MASNLPKERLHPDIIKLGIVSFLTDLSSEMIFSVFAIFFTTVAGASASLLGLIEGLADFSASSLNYLAGWLSDRGGKRKEEVLPCTCVVEVKIRPRHVGNHGVYHHRPNLLHDAVLLDETGQSLTGKGVERAAHQVGKERGGIRQFGKLLGFAGAVADGQQPCLRVGNVGMDRGQQSAHAIAALVFALVCAADIFRQHRPQ